MSWRCIGGERNTTHLKGCAVRLLGSAGTQHQPPKILEGEDTALEAAVRRIAYNLVMCQTN
jgi:hypothetical protein